MTGKSLPSSVRKMTGVERAWVGAFIEADGCAFICYGKRRAVSIRLAVGQKDVDPIATLLRVTQVGSIQYWKEEDYEIWRWTANRKNDALDIAEQCAPYSWKIQRVLEEMP